MKQRIIVCPLIQNDGAYLLCKMPAHRAVFPGQWALSGGGLEPGETIQRGLLREIREELGDRLRFEKVIPWTFRDDTRTKTFASGAVEPIYMIYLIFDCYAVNRDVELNEEFESYAWVRPERLNEYDLNEAARLTMSAKGRARAAAVDGCGLLSAAVAVAVAELAMHAIGYEGLLLVLAEQLRQAIDSGDRGMAAAGVRAHYNRAMAHFRRDRPDLRAILTRAEGTGMRRPRASRRDAMETGGMEQRNDRCALVP